MTGHTFRRTEAKYNFTFFSMIAQSFYNKRDMDQWLKPNIHLMEYEQGVHNMWEHIVEKNLSFIITNNETNVPLGVTINYDAYVVPELNTPNKLMILEEFEKYVQQPVKDKLPVGKGKILYNFEKGTNPDLSDQENVEVIQFMENQVLKLAKTRGFAGVLSISTSPRTQVSNMFLQSN